MKTQKRTIVPGTKFVAPSLGKPNQKWIVTYRIKTDERNVIYTRCNATGQHRKYTNKQFHKLLVLGIIKLNRK